LAPYGVKAAAVNIHYLSTGLDLEVALPAASSLGALESETQGVGRVDLAALKARLGARKVHLLLELDAVSAQDDSATPGAKAGAAAEKHAQATEPHSAT
jgi:hypothetical protein